MPEPEEEHQPASSEQAEPIFMKLRAGRIVHTEPKPVIESSESIATYIHTLADQGPKGISQIVDAIIAEEDAAQAKSEESPRYRKKVEYERDAL